VKGDHTTPDIIRPAHILFAGNVEQGDFRHDGDSYKTPIESAHPFLISRSPRGVRGSLTYKDIRSSLHRHIVYIVYEAIPRFS